MSRYSHTRLSTFETCPRQFFYRYVARVPVDYEEGIEGFLGSMVHEALEKLYRDKMFGKTLSAEEQLAYFNGQWERRFHNGIAVTRPEYGPEDYRRSGEDCLRAYHARYAPFDQSKTLVLEDKITADVGNGHEIIGYIDRLSQTSDGTHEIHDYKTNLRLPTQEEKDQDRQLALYQLGIQDRWNDVSRVELIWHYLRHDKEIRSSRTSSDLESLKTGTVRLIDDIESRGDNETAFEPRESALCDWCSFQSICPIRKHLFRVDSLHVNRFLEEAGVQLVNQLAVLKDRHQQINAQLAELENERGQIEEALVAYADREGAAVITGSEYEFRVSRCVEPVLPRKTYEPDAYTALESSLRGQPMWPAVSSVDMPKLRRIWAGEEPDPGIREIMQPFVKEQEVVRTSLRKRKELD